VKIKIVWIGRTKERAIQELTEDYVKRISHYAPVEGIAVRDEAALLEMCGRSAAAKGGKGLASGKSTLVLMDSGGKELSSEGFARFLEDYQGRNPLPLVFAIGPADGFGEASKAAAQQTISLGKITLAHELARVVLLEQIYRAFTIIKDHPYHTGH
jgi:23S rRNA (pseudouridine1915-N3)-methyltransferase